MSVIKNVIYIHTHDMGRYISPYGYSMPTPNLERFASEAALFRNAYCCGPTCSPSRAGLLTGVTPHESGMLGLAHRGFVFEFPEYHLAAYLKSQGFMTALCGIQHEFNSAWEQMPYEYAMLDALEEGPAATDRFWTDAACDFLQRGSDRPFFLSYGLFYPHREFEKADEEKYPVESIQVPDCLPDTPEVRKDLADYQCSVALADECIGRVLTAIRDAGRDQDSLVIVTTDHGIAFPNMKCNLKDDGIGVTLMMAYPGNPSTGQSINGLVSHLDVYPTVCDLLGLPTPSHLEGVSLQPLLEGRKQAIRDEVFSEVNYHAAYEPMRCIRTERFKLIRRFDVRRRVLSNCDDSPSKRLLMETGWRCEELSEYELYDLSKDPRETTNLASEQAYTSVMETLQGLLQRWMIATNDPLLNGPVPHPEGALVNSSMAVSPTEGPFESHP